MRLGVRLPGPFWLSTRIGTGCGCLWILIVPLELSLWLLIAAAVLVILAVKGYIELAKQLWPRGWWGKATTIAIPVILIVIGSIAGAASRNQPTGDVGKPPVSAPPALAGVSTPAPTPTADTNPRRHHDIAQASASASAPSSGSNSAGGCYPTTSSGHCYEPGEFCKTSQHGESGIAADGEAITCDDNDGWRWEPASSVSSPEPSPSTSTPTPTSSASPPPTTSPPPTSSPPPTTSLPPTTSPSPALSGA